MHATSNNKLINGAYRSG